MPTAPSNDSARQKAISVINPAASPPLPMQPFQKSLTRYRFDKVQERAKLKQSVSRLVTILFPELEQLVSSIHGTSIYALLSEYPGAKQISEAHLTRLANILVTTSRGPYRKDRATHIRDAARTSIGSVMPAKSLELKHTIKLDDSCRGGGFFKF